MPVSRVESFPRENFQGSGAGIYLVHLPLRVFDINMYIHFSGQLSLTHSLLLSLEKLSLLNSLFLSLGKLPLPGEANGIQAQAKNNLMSRPVT